MPDQVQLPFPTARVLVVSDFNCPYCYTLNEWLHQLGAGPRVRWVGIEHRPDLPVSGSNSQGDRDTLAREVSDVQRRAPQVGLIEPPGWFNSRKALLLQNALEDEAPEEAYLLRRAIFRSYWTEGTSLGGDELYALVADLKLPTVDDEPEVLDELSEWWRSELDRIPCMLAPTGITHFGLQDFRSVKSFLNSAIRAGTAGPGCR